MGLLNTWGAHNRQIDEDLAVTYSRTWTYGTWTYNEGLTTHTLYRVWLYTRNASKSYRYVGMDYATAVSCAAAVRAIYNRSTRISVWPDDDSGEFVEEDGGVVPMADVSVRHVEGPMWEVAVQVSETDTRLRKDPASPAVLFAAEDARDYDTGELNA